MTAPPMASALERAVLADDERLDTRWKARPSHRTSPALRHDAPARTPEVEGESRLSRAVRLEEERLATAWKPRTDARSDDEQLPADVFEIET